MSSIVPRRSKSAGTTIALARRICGSLGDGGVVGRDHLRAVGHVDLVAVVGAPGCGWR